MMFSATFNKKCRELARKYLADDHVRIRIGRAGSSHMNVEQQVSDECSQDAESKLTFSDYLCGGTYEEAVSL